MLSTCVPPSIRTSAKRYEHPSDSPACKGTEVAAVVPGQRPASCCFQNWVERTFGRQCPYGVHDLAAQNAFFPSLSR